MRSAMRARLQQAVDFHAAMAKAYEESAGQEKKQPEQPSQPVEQYTPQNQQPAGEEIAGEATAPPDEGSELTEDTQEVQATAQQGERAEAAPKPEAEPEDANGKIALMHKRAAEQLQELLAEDTRPGITQLRANRPMIRDPAQAAQAERNRLREAAQRPMHARGRQAGGRAR